jgi:hypothetical protein
MPLTRQIRIKRCLRPDQAVYLAVLPERIKMGGLHAPYILQCLKSLRYEGSQGKEISTPYLLVFD